MSIGDNVLTKSKNPWLGMYKNRSMKFAEFENWTLSYVESKSKAVNREDAPEYLDYIFTVYLPVFHSLMLFQCTNFEFSLKRMAECVLGREKYDKLNQHKGNGVEKIRNWMKIQGVCWPNDPKTWMMISDYIKVRNSIAHIGMGVYFDRKIDNLCKRNIVYGLEYFGNTVVPTKKYLSTISLILEDTLHECTLGVIRIAS